MPWYNDLRPPSDDSKKDYSLVFPDKSEFSKTDKKRTIKNLLDLRRALDKEVPSKRADQNLLIASWNIKEFGHTKQRLPESYFYIAEIMNRFDLVVVQEVKSSLKDMNIIMRLLGSDWAYLINDITEGTKGNRERSAYIYNKKRVQPSGLAGEIALWGELTDSSSIKQLHRSPYITGFKSGWKSFALICLHLIPGDSAEKLAARKEEVELLMKALEYKLDKGHLWSDHLILVGDMNFYKPTASDPKDKEALERIAKLFREISTLQDLDTNASQTEAFDRMFFHTDPSFFQIATNSQGKESAGVFSVFDHIFTLDDHTAYKNDLIKAYGDKEDAARDVKNNESDRISYYKHYWRKNQISDHFPIWAEIIIDSSDNFLAKKLSEF